MELAVFSVYRNISATCGTSLEAYDWPSKFFYKNILPWSCTPCFLDDSYSVCGKTVGSTMLVLGINQGVHLSSL